MVTFRVGDIVTLCVSMKDFCGSTSQFYTVNDLDCAIGTCPVSSTPFYCLSPSGISVTFQWTSSTENRCTSLNNLKTLGTATTNSVGIATLQYTITQNDLDIFNIAIADPDYYGRFDLRVCYNRGGNVGGIYSEIRGKADDIVIEQATHLECESGICTQVTGIGTNTCTTIGNTTQCRHLECVSGICTELLIPGTNTCATIGSTTECASPVAYTHYIEYDINILPSEVLNYVNGSMITVSNNIAEYLPLSDNIIYDHSEYLNSSKKFRIYVHYTPTLGLIESIESYIPLGLIETIESYARVIVGIIAFILTYLYTKSFGIYGLIGAAGIGLFAAMITACIIVELSKPSKSKDVTEVIPIPKQIETIRTFVEEYGKPSCALLYPDCSKEPVDATCTDTRMRLYLSCRAGFIIAEKWHDDDKSGTSDQTELDDLIRRIQDIDKKLEDGSITKEQAKDALEKEQDDVTDNSEEKEDLTTCDTGFVYDINTHKCIATQDCCISLPLVGCIISKELCDTAKTAAYVIVGGAVIYLGYNIYTSMQPSKK